MSVHEVRLTSVMQVSRSNKSIFDSQLSLLFVTFACGSFVHIFLVLSLFLVSGQPRVHVCGLPLVGGTMCEWQSGLYIALSSLVQGWDTGSGRLGY